MCVGWAGVATLAVGMSVACDPLTLPTDILGSNSLAGDAIALTSITPSAGTHLRAGRTVTFTATLTYTLASAARGQIAVVIQDQFDRNLRPPDSYQTFVQIARGTGTVTLSDSIALPGSGVSYVSVFFPLSAGLSPPPTDVIVKVSYPVD